MKHSAQDNQEDQQRYNIAANVSSAVIAVAVVSVGFYCWWFFFQNERSLSVNSSDWGAFGDFVGGITNPLVAFSALIWLIASVRIQRDELRQTRKELEAAAEAQSKTVEHHANMKRIQDCQTFIQLITQQIDEILEKEYEYNIDPTRQYALIASPDTNRSLWELLTIVNEVNHSNLFDDFHTTFNDQLRNAGEKLSRCPEALEYWRQLHGNEACFSVEYYIQKLAPIARELGYYRHTPAEAADYFSKIVVRPPVTD